MRDAGELLLREQLRPAHRARLGDAREIVALQVDDHHVLRRVLGRLDGHTGGPRAFDRRRAYAQAAALEQELRRRGDDRPSVAL